jgi:hypothetical protein|tara:strand:+ start:337 stop:753 length:417 start_codon:yes stop_codon:yes gene_type:complete
MYRIGQVLYIIANGTKTIEPVQVHSKQILESWEGTSVQHMCATVDNKTISLEDHSEKGLLAGVFESVEESKVHLLELASEMVENLAHIAREKAASFESSQLEVAVDVSQSVNLPVSGVSTVILDDGTRARVHLPTNLE